MKEYSSKIALIKNSRSIYCLDTSIGCSSGLQNDKKGCYNDCYAAKSAKQYGFDFSKTVLRNFESIAHQREVLTQISKVKLDFIRIGCSGDPSENWRHCIDILKVVSKSNKEIVIITKHWALLTDEQLQFFSTINICINTSVSALDNPDQLNKCLKQYNRIKPFCKSVLRIVSCDFNLENTIGRQLNIIQKSLFLNENIIDTVFRPAKSNPFVKIGVINAKYGVFLGKKCFMSKFNKKTYTGKCSTCIEMCGVNLKNENYNYPNKRLLTKQLLIFNK